MRCTMFCKNLVLLCLLLHSVSAAALENSIVPLVETYKVLENLDRDKYSDAQHEEIVAAFAHRDDQIRVVSYNMLFNLYDENLEEAYRWPQRLPRLLALIEEMKPDIIGIQELHVDQFDDLQEHIQNTYSYYARTAYNGELNIILYRTDRFCQFDRHIWSMTTTPHEPSNYTLGMVHLKDLQTRKSFAVFNTHFAFSNVNKRDYQARFVAEYAEDVAEVMPVVVMGDFNTFPHYLEQDKLPFYDGDHIHRILTQWSLRDSKDVALLGHVGPLSTFTNKPGDTLPFQGTGTPGVFLDHIYVSPGIEVWMHAVQPATVDGYFPSDHMPVFADLYVK